jgi:hypothetical protein
VLCDTESTDVLRNTRTISGSRLSQRYTNGNNFHVEHHAAMAVPINRLSERHPLAKSLAKYTPSTAIWSSTGESSRKRVSTLGTGRTRPPQVPPNPGRRMGVSPNCSPLSEAQSKVSSYEKTSDRCDAARTDDSRENALMENLCFEGAPPTHSSAMTRPQPLSIGSARMMSSYNSRDRTSER